MAQPKPFVKNIGAPEVARDQSGQYSYAAARERAESTANLIKQIGSLGLQAYKAYGEVKAERDIEDVFSNLEVQLPSGQVFRGAKAEDTYQTKIKPMEEQASLVMGVQASNVNAFSERDIAQEVPDMVEAARANIAAEYGDRIKAIADAKAAGGILTQDQAKTRLAAIYKEAAATHPGLQDVIKQVFLEKTGRDGAAWAYEKEREALTAVPFVDKARAAQQDMLEKAIFQETVRLSEKYEVPVAVLHANPSLKTALQNKAAEVKQLEMRVADLKAVNEREGADPESATNQLVGSFNNVALSDVQSLVAATKEKENKLMSSYGPTTDETTLRRVKAEVDAMYAQQVPEYTEAITKQYTLTRDRLIKEGVYNNTVAQRLTQERDTLLGYVKNFSGKAGSVFLEELLKSGPAERQQLADMLAIAQKVSNLAGVTNEAVGAIYYRNPQAYIATIPDPKQKSVTQSAYDWTQRAIAAANNGTNFVPKVAVMSQIAGVADGLVKGEGIPANTSPEVAGAAVRTLLTVPSQELFTNLSKADNPQKQADAYHTLKVQAENIGESHPLFSSVLNAVTTQGVVKAGAPEKEVYKVVSGTLAKHLDKSNPNSVISQSEQRAFNVLKNSDPTVQKVEFVPTKNKAGLPEIDVVITYKDRKTSLLQKEEQPSVLGAPKLTTEEYALWKEAHSVRQYHRLKVPLDEQLAKGESQ